MPSITTSESEKSICRRAVGGVSSWLAFAIGSPIYLRISRGGGTCLERQFPGRFYALISGPTWKASQQVLDEIVTPALQGAPARAAALPASRPSCPSAPLLAQRLPEGRGSVHRPVGGATNRARREDQCRERVASRRLAQLRDFPEPGPEGVRIS